MGEATEHNRPSESRAVRKLLGRLRRGESVDWREAERDCPGFLARSGANLKRFQSVADSPSVLRHPEESPPQDSGTDQATMELLARELPGYEPLVQLGRGGQGVVYEAEQLATKRHVAIKVLAEGPFASSRQISRFTREIELVARLRHPSIVTVHESGVVCGRPYLVMELVDGLPIDEYALLNGRGAREIVAMFEKVCDGVSHAHQRGVIHRDLKPSNVIVDPAGEPRILDFGLAKDAVAPQSGCTLSGQIIGTLQYASPEQALGKGAEADVRTDVYALGLILFKTITGSFPYRVSGTTKEILDSITDHEPRKLRTTILEDVEPEFRRMDGINTDLDRIVRKALEKEPDRRYQSVAALADDLRRYLAGEPVEAGIGASAYLLRKTIRRFRVPISIAAVFVLTLMASLVTVTRAWRQERETRRAAQTGLQMASFLKTARAERDAGRPDEAIDLLEQAIIFGEQVEATDPLVREVLFNNYYTVAELYVDKGDLAQGQKYRALASGLAQKLLADHPTDPEVRRYVAFASFLAAKELAGREEWAAALEEVAKCEAAFRSLLEDGIATDRLKYDLALALFVKGRCHRNSAKEPEAWGAYEEARELLESLVREEPDHYGYSIELSRIETEMALVHMRRKTIDDNEAACSLLVSAGARLDGFADPERARNLAREIQPLRESIQRNRDVVNKRLTTTPSHTSRSDH